jgi:hypothetical protein
MGVVGGGEEERERVREGTGYSFCCEMKKTFISAAHRPLGALGEVIHRPFFITILESEEVIIMNHAIHAREETHNKPPTFARRQRQRQ